MTDIDPPVERLLRNSNFRDPSRNCITDPGLLIEAANRIQSDAKIIAELQAALNQAQDHVCMAYCHFGNGDYEDASEHKQICVDLRAALEPKKVGFVLSPPHVNMASWILSNVQSASYLPDDLS